MPAFKWREFTKKNRRLLVALVAAVAAAAGVPAIVSNPAVVEQIWQSFESQQDAETAAPGKP
jgi:hypothetical protein